MTPPPAPPRADAAAPPWPDLPPGFSLHAFTELDPNALYAILALRQRVFVVEQDCVFLDADGRDAEALHLVHRTRSGEVDAYARLFLPSTARDHVEFGRIVTAPEVRGTGLGKHLVAAALDAVATLAPGAPIHINAQAHLDRWYRRFGFEPVGEPYLYDGILHLAMTLRAGALTAARAPSARAP